MPLFHPSNLPYWILLGMGVALFVFVIVSGGSDDDLDVDADVDADLDVDGGGGPLVLDADVDADDFSMTQALAGLGVGRAPLILLLATDLSLWGVLGWMLNVFIGGVLGGLLGGLVGGTILLGSLVVSLLLGGQIAKPIGKIFASFGEDASGDRLIGCVGTVSTVTIPRITEGKIGQVDVLDSARNLVTVNAVLPEWATIFPQRGTKMLVIERSESSYLVIAKDSPDQEYWLNQSARPKDSR